MKITLTAIGGFESLRHGDVIAMDVGAGPLEMVISRRSSATNMDAYPYTWWRWAWYRVMRLWY